MSSEVASLPCEDQCLHLKYVLPLNPDINCFSQHSNRLKRAELLTGCRLIFCQKMLNRRFNRLNSWRKYAILRVIAPDEWCLKSFNKLLEKAFPCYSQRRLYNKDSDLVTMITPYNCPDNSMLSTCGHRQKQTTPFFGGINLSAPNAANGRRSSSATPWKYNHSEMLGFYDVDDGAVSANVRPGTLLSASIDKHQSFYDLQGKRLYSTKSCGRRSAPPLRPNFVDAATTTDHAASQGAVPPLAVGCMKSDLNRSNDKPEISLTDLECANQCKDNAIVDDPAVIGKPTDYCIAEPIINSTDVAAKVKQVNPVNEWSKCSHGNRLRNTSAIKDELEQELYNLINMASDEDDNNKDVEDDDENDHIDNDDVECCGNDHEAYSAAVSTNRCLIYDNFSPKCGFHTVRPTINNSKIHADYVKSSIKAQGDVNHCIMQSQLSKFLHPVSRKRSVQVPSDYNCPAKFNGIVTADNGTGVPSGNFNMSNADEGCLVLDGGSSECCNRTECPDVHRRTSCCFLSISSEFTLKFQGTRLQIVTKETTEFNTPKSLMGKIQFSISSDHYDIVIKSKPCPGPIANGHPNKTTV